METVRVIIMSEPQASMSSVTRHSIGKAGGKNLLNLIGKLKARTETKNCTHTILLWSVWRQVWGMVGRGDLQLVAS